MSPIYLEVSYDDAGRTVPWRRSIHLPIYLLVMSTCALEPCAKVLLLGGWTFNSRTVELGILPSVCSPFLGVTLTTS